MIPDTQAANESAIGRGRLPSASGIQRIALCRGSWLACADIKAEPSSEVAEVGNRIHNYLAGQPQALNDEELELARRCASLEVALLPKDSGPLTVLREVRLHLNDGGNRVASGQADAIHIYEDAAHVFDYKTGRGEVESAEGNLQLRTLAALVAERFPDLPVIVVGIIQPLASPAVTTCVYTREDLHEARAQILGLVKGAWEPDAPRVAGESQCKYCRARTSCPELARVTAALTTVDVGGLEVARLPMLLEACATADKHIEAIRKAARALLEANPDAIAGWRLKDGAKVQCITDPQGVFARWRAMGFSSESFMSAVEIGKGKLALSLKNNSGATGRALEEEFAVLTAGMTETKQNAPSLARVKKD